MWVRAAVGIGLLGYIAGFAAACSFRSVTLSPWGSAPIVLVCLLAMCLVAKWCFRRLDELEAERDNMRKGARGEVTVGLTLDQFPDEFRVVHDVATPFGNLDHAVVGPTGVFVIDSKDWKGIVAADGQGELTLNGKPLDKPYVRRFVARVMDVREKVQVLAPGPDPYFQAVFVFTSARVEAKFGTTRSVHCVREEQLFNYIVNTKFGKRLSAAEVARIAQAFVGLAHMEAGFSDKAPLQERKAAEPSERRKSRARTGNGVAAGART